MISLLGCFAVRWHWFSLFPVRRVLCGFEGSSLGFYRKLIQYKLIGPIQSDLSRTKKGCDVIGTLRSFMNLISLSMHSLWI